MNGFRLHGRTLILLVLGFCVAAGSLIWVIEDSSLLITERIKNQQELLDQARRLEPVNAGDTAVLRDLLALVEKNSTTPEGTSVQVVSEKMFTNRRHFVIEVELVGSYNQHMNFFAGLNVLSRPVYLEEWLMTAQDSYAQNPAIVLKVTLLIPKL